MLKHNRVGQILSITFISQFLLLLLAQWSLRSGPFVTSLFTLGVDFRFFYDAGGHWLAGVNPYVDRNFTAPPSALLVGAVLHWLPFPTAKLVFAISNIVAVFLALGLVARRLKLSQSSVFDLCLIALTFSAFHSVIAAGNLDALILLLLSVAYACHSKWGSSIALGIASALKVYTGLVCLVLLRKRKPLELGVLVATVAALMLPFVNDIPHGLLRVTERAGYTRTLGNISPGRLFIELIGPSGTGWKVAYLVFWIGTLAWTFSKDVTRSSRQSVLVYIPWMLAMPALVLRYVGVIALGVMARLIKIGAERKLKTGEWLMVAGCVLLGSYPVVFASILPLNPETYQLIIARCDGLNAIGTTLLVIGATLSAESWSAALPEEA